MDKRINDLEDIKTVLDSFKVRFFIVYGALLGMHRDGKLIEHDDDIDIAIIDPIDFKTRKLIGRMLFELGFKSQEITFNVFGVMETQEEGYNGDEKTGIIVCERDFKFTIFFFKEVPCETHGAEYLCVPKLGALNLISIPKKFFDKSDTIKIGSSKYLTPSPIEDYLDFTYFNNWKDKEDRRHGDTYYKMHPLQEQKLRKQYENN